MWLYTSVISCGIGELSDIGTPQKNAKLPRNWNCYATILASLTDKQKRAIKFVKKNGFKQVGKARVNPNSGNKILLFKKDVAKKDQIKD